MEPVATHAQSMLQIYEALLRWFTLAAALAACLMALAYVLLLWLECFSLPRPLVTSSPRPDGAGTPPMLEVSALRQSSLRIVRFLHRAWTTTAFRLHLGHGDGRTKPA